MRSSGFIFKAGQKAPPQRARLGPYCRAKRPLFLSHPPWARALHPTRDTRWDSTGWACVVDEPPRPPRHQGVGLFAHGLAGNPRPGRSSRRWDQERAGNPRAAWFVPSRRQQWPDHSFPGDPNHPRTCRVGMVRPAQVRESDTMPPQPPASCEAHQATPGEKARRPVKVGPSGIIFYERHFLPCVFDDSKKNPQSRVKSLCSPPFGRPWTAEPLFLLSGCANLVRKGGRYGI